MQWNDFIFFDIDRSRVMAIANVVSGPIAIILTLPGFSLIKEVSLNTPDIPDYADT